MAEAVESTNAASVAVVTKEQFHTYVEAQLRKYLSDAELAPLLKLLKEAGEVQQKINEVMDELESYDRQVERITKNQEIFLHKNGLLPKHNTRTVGVNVNIITPEERMLLALDAKERQQPTTPAIKVESGSPLVPKLAPSQASPNKSNDPKRKSIDLVDLTDDDDRSGVKRSRVKDSPGSANAVGKPLDGAQVVHRNAINQTTVPLMMASPQVIQIGRPPVHYPQGRIVAAAILNQPQTSSSIRGHPSRNVPVLLPKLPVGVVRRVSIPSGQPGVSSVALPKGLLHSPRTVFVATTGPILSGRTTLQPLPTASRVVPNHPAPLPEGPKYTPSELAGLLEPPPKPSLKISKPASGIVLSWNMTLTAAHDEIKTYQLYGYEETVGPAMSLLWKKIGEINALPLPMACTLTQFNDGGRYHFAIRAIDVHKRIGPFSDVVCIPLPPLAAAK